MQLSTEHKRQKKCFEKMPEIPHKNYVAVTTKRYGNIVLFFDLFFLFLSFYAYKQLQYLNHNKQFLCRIVCFFNSPCLFGNVYFQFSGPCNFVSFMKFHIYFLFAKCDCKSYWGLSPIIGNRLWSDRGEALKNSFFVQGQFL